MQLSAMRDLDTAELLGIWDTGQRAPPMRRAWLLLRHAYPEESIDPWPLGRVNVGLLWLRECWFGNEWPCLVNCPACGEVNEITLRIDTLLDGHPSGPQPAPMGNHRVEKDGWTVDFRLPCASDLLDIGRTVVDARGLLDRVVGDVSHEGASAAIRNAPESTLQLIGKQIEMADPMASIGLSLSCSACGQAWNEPLHVIDVFWSELSALAERLLSEVGRLAQSFGWGEAEILAMSAQRRQRYLEWLGA